MVKSTYSIYGHFRSSTVLLTGASGYVGGLVLEALLRKTDVARIYVLLRPKRGDDIYSRLHRMLDDSAIMHLLRGNEVLRKVEPIAGDMRSPDLGISTGDRRRLQQEVDTVIHCAADIRLEAGIQDLVTCNYEGTRQLLKFCCSFSQLASFVHVSSAYTNMNAPVGSLVKEAFYPLMYGDQPVDDYELVQELMSVPAHTASSRAEGLMKAWNFPNSYTLSKHLAEYMVADYHKHCKLPIAIVRPTLISSVARDPYPGYTGNYAGHVGATLAFMAGLFDHPDASAYKASNVWDVIPADVVVNDILAAAAAVGAGMSSSCCVTKTRNGRILSSPCSSSTTTTGADKPADKNIGKSRCNNGYATIELQISANSVEQQAKQQQQSSDDLLIIHCGSSTLYPLTIMESWNYGIEGYGAWPQGHRLCRSCAAPLTVDHEPDTAKAALHAWWTGWKVWVVALLLRWFGMDKIAKKLIVGFESFKILNQPKTDVNLRFSTANMQKLASKLDPSERSQFLLLWKPVAAQQFLPSAGTNTDTAIVTSAAPKSGLSSAAAPMNAPMTSRLQSASSADIEGVIRAGTLSALGSSSSTSTYGGSTRSGSVDSDGVNSGSSSDVELPGSDTDDSAGSSSSSDLTTSTGRQQHGAKLGSEQEAALARMHAVPIQWRDFHVNMGAFLYCTVFRMPLPSQVASIIDERVINWFKIKPEQRVLKHQFQIYE